AQYLSPEQAQGKETTPRSDIYSIGVILYEALTGRVPFEGDSAVAVALKQVSEAPRRPSAINPKIPPALDAVVMRALAKDPEARFKDADAFLRGLDAAERMPDRPRPEDTAAFAAVSPAGEIPEDAEEEEEYEDWHDEEERRRRRRWIILAILAALVAALVAFALTRPSQIAVPDVIGQNVDAATEILENQGFDVAIKAVPSGAPRDQVVEQDPIPTNRGGGKAEEGSTVTLSVSSGPAIVAVPEVLGLTREEALKRLENAGFQVTVAERFSEMVPRGGVIGTEPAAGTQLSTAQPVTLLISRGSDRVEVPDVVGIDDQAALNALSEAELVGTIVQRDSEEPEGEVVGQSPAAGERVRRGSQVTIFVSSGAIAVPDVVAQPRRRAVTTLKRAGFVVAVTEETTDDPTQVGRVISEFPPGGSRAQRGDSVTISVGVAAEPTVTTP
ncbi:MAG TPA: PASTA domain-containing protein, partial [Solirubrobacterales bacterium]|nr:PASTA domain-containing protein [Solirubrobacterales bacterium]